MARKTLLQLRASVVFFHFFFFQKRQCFCCLSSIFPLVSVFIDQASGAYSACSVISIVGPMSLPSQAHDTQQKVHGESSVHCRTLTLNCSAKTERWLKGHNKFGNPLCCLLDSASYKICMVTPYHSSDKQSIFLQAPTPPLTYVLLTSPSWSASLLVSLNNSDTEIKMSWTYATLLAFLTVLLALSCESESEFISGVSLKGAA